MSKCQYVNMLKSQNAEMLKAVMSKWWKIQMLKCLSVIIFKWWKLKFWFSHYNFSHCTHWWPLKSFQIAQTSSIHTIIAMVIAGTARQFTFTPCLFQHGDNTGAGDFNIAAAIDRCGNRKRAKGSDIRRMNCDQLIVSAWSVDRHSLGVSLVLDRKSVV